MKQDGLRNKRNLQLGMLIGFLGIFVGLILSQNIILAMILVTISIVVSIGWLGFKKTYQILSLISLVLVICGAVLLAGEIVLRTLRSNCVLDDCKPPVDKIRQSIYGYAASVQKAYPDEPWVEPFSLEIGTVLQQEDARRYQPYVETRLAPFEGEYVNVNPNGLRIVPQSECDDENAYHVVTFGNSAMWGAFAADDSTLAAFIQQELATFMNQPVCLVNYAQGAYNSTQSLIELINLIQGGNIPDLVIYYDGATDVLSTGNYRRANTPLRANVVSEKLGTITKPLTIEQQFHNWLISLEVVKLADNVFDLELEEALPSTDYSQPGLLSRRGDKDEAMDDLIKLLTTNYEIIELLADQYNFEYAIFVQPVSFIGDKLLTEKEQSQVDDGWPGSEAKKIYKYVYPVLEMLAKEQPNIYFLGNVFDGMAEQLYIDPLHVNTAGDKIIAAYIGDVIESVWNER